MKFQDLQTENVYDVRPDNGCVDSGFCNKIQDCNQCPITEFRDGTCKYCTDWVLSNPDLAASLMGYKTIEEESNNNDSNMVNHPSHYNQGGIECIDAIKSATCDLDGLEAFCTGNAIKYLWRWKEKNGVEDLDKAIWYINKLKESISDDERT